MDTNEVMAVKNYSVNSNLQIGYSSSGDTGSYGNTCWDYWQNWYYPTVIHTSYPIYVQERALDKGKKSFEIIKILRDKKLVHINKVSDFIDLMDALISIL